MKALIVSFLLGISATTLAHAEDWKIGCTNGVCVIINNDGQITWFDPNQHKASKGPKIEIKGGAVSVSCQTTNGHEQCELVDGDGQLWVGPARANNDKYQVVTTVPK